MKQFYLCSTPECSGEEGYRCTQVSRDRDPGHPRRGGPRSPKKGRAPITQEGEGVGEAEVEEREEGGPAQTAMETGK